MHETNQADLDNWFRFQPPEEITDPQTRKKTADAYLALRREGKNFASLILAVGPACPETTVAIRKVREAVMMAVQGIAAFGIRRPGEAEENEVV